MTTGGLSSTGPMPTVEVCAMQARASGAEIAVLLRISAGERSEQRTLVLRTEDFLELKISKGPIDPEVFDLLEQASQVRAAMLCGESVLSYGPNTRLMLARKIMRHGYGRGEAEAAVDRLAEMGLIDEESDMQREVEKCLAKLWGEGRIRNHLYTRGFGIAALERLPAMLADVDFAANCRRLIEKHYGGLPGNRDGDRCMIGGLYRYGYRAEEIRAAVGELRRQAGKTGENGEH